MHEVSGHGQDSLRMRTESGYHVLSHQAPGGKDRTASVVLSYADKSSFFIFLSTIESFIMMESTENMVHDSAEGGFLRPSSRPSPASFELS